MAHSRRRVRRAVVLAAGYGTRLLPATKAQPKEALPLVDKPIIQYTVEEAAASGLEQVIIVTASGKRAVEDHFDRSLELEQALRQKGDLERLEEIQAISDLADIVYVRQKQQLGVGHAVLTVRDVVGQEPFVLFFPDDVIIADVPVARQMLDVFEEYGAPILAVERVAAADIENYGVVDPEPVRDRLVRVKGLVEKPTPEEAPSDLGIVGRYVLTSDIFAALDATRPGKGKEIQLTDALQRLRRQQAIYAYEFEGERYDAGTPQGWLETTIALALKDPVIGPRMIDYINGLLHPAICPR